jgi:hypothetical protein
VDLTDTFVHARVRTIVVFGDIVAAYATAGDQRVLDGNAMSGQVVGVDSTAGINTIAVSALTAQGGYSAFADAIPLVHTERFLPPEVIVMHPRQWGWLLWLPDTAGRPLLVRTANGAGNAHGVLTDVAELRAAPARVRMLAVPRVYLTSWQINLSGGNAVKTPVGRATIPV